MLPFFKHYFEITALFTLFCLGRNIDELLEKAGCERMELFALAENSEAVSLRLSQESIKFWYDFTSHEAYFRGELLTAVELPAYEKLACWEEYMLFEHMQNRFLMNLDSERLVSVSLSTEEIELALEALGDFRSLCLDHDDNRYAELCAEFNLLLSTLV